MFAQQGCDDALDLNFRLPTCAATTRVFRQAALRVDLALLCRSMWSFLSTGVLADLFAGSLHCRTGIDTLSSRITTRGCELHSAVEQLFGKSELETLSQPRAAAPVGRRSANRRFLFFLSSCHGN